MNEHAALMGLSISCRVEEVGGIQNLTSGPMVETIVDESITARKIL